MHCNIPQCSRLSTVLPSTTTVQRPLIITVCPINQPFTPELSEQGESPRNISLTRREIGPRRQESALTAGPETLQSLHARWIPPLALSTIATASTTPNNRRNEGAPLLACLPACLPARLSVWKPCLQSQFHLHLQLQLSDLTCLLALYTTISLSEAPSTHNNNPLILSTFAYTSSPRRTILAHYTQLEDDRLANPALAPRSSTFLRQAGTTNRNNTPTVQPFADRDWNIRGTPTESLLVTSRHPTWTILPVKGTISPYNSLLS